MKLLSVTPAPHIWAKDDTQSIMRDVLIALAPAFIAFSLSELSFFRRSEKFSNKQTRPHFSAAAKTLR